MFAEGVVSHRAFGGVRVGLWALVAASGIGVGSVVSAAEEEGRAAGAESGGYAEAVLAVVPPRLTRDEGVEIADARAGAAIHPDWEENPIIRDALNARLSINDRPFRWVGYSSQRLGEIEARLREGVAGGVVDGEALPIEVVAHLVRLDRDMDREARLLDGWVRSYVRAGVEAREFARDQALEVRRDARRDAAGIAAIETGRATGNVEVREVTRTGTSGPRAATDAETLEFLAETGRGLNARAEVVESGEEAVDGARERGAALRSLHGVVEERLRAAAPSARERMGAWLASDDPQTRVTAAGMIGDWCGPSALALLRGPLADEDEAVREAAGSALERMDVTVVQVRRLLRDDEPRVRLAAVARARPMIRTHEGVGVAILSPAFADADDGVRAAAYEATEPRSVQTDRGWYGEAGVEAGEVAGALALALRQSDRGVVLDALAYLKEMDREDVPASLEGPVRRLLMSRDEAVRRAAQELVEPIRRRSIFGGD